MKKTIISFIAVAAFVVLTGAAQAGQQQQQQSDCPQGQVTTQPTPDAGTTSALMGIALVGLAAVRRFVR